MSEPLSDIASEQPRPSRRRGFRFSIKTLLVTTAVVAAFLGGRASKESPWGAPRAGTWQLRLSGGHQTPVSLTWLGDGKYLLGTQGVLGGIYRWKAGKLVVETPGDPRYVGLEWEWQGDDLMLVAEPPNTPAGPSYLGATLRFLSEDISQAQEAAILQREKFTRAFNSKGNPREPQ